MKYLNEKIFPDDIDLPVKCSKKYGKVTANWHMHKEIEIVLITQGYEKYNFIDGSESLQMGDIIIVASNVSHYTTQPEDLQTGIINVQFDKNLIMSEMGDLKYSFPFLNAKDFFVIKNTSETQFFCKILQDIYSEFSEKQMGYKTVVKSQLCSFITFMIRLYGFYSENQTKTITQKNIETVIKYIDENYSQKITLEDLSKKAGYSYNFFCKFFKENIGTHFIDYLNNVRIKMQKTFYLQQMMRLPIFV